MIRVILKKKEISEALLSGRYVRFIKSLMLVKLIKLYVFLTYVLSYCCIVSTIMVNIDEYKAETGRGVQI